jgi:hypothetical protein
LYRLATQVETLEDSFEWRAFDGTDYSNTATVHIDVWNSAPQADDVWYDVHWTDTLQVSASGAQKSVSKRSDTVMLQRIQRGTMEAL